jgi:hypothetical protein
MSKNKPANFKLKVDIQCGICGALSHLKGEQFPKFCPCCGAALERFCLLCQKKAELYFEEWWPEDDECLRTYCPPKRCSGCNSMLESEDAGGEHPREERGYQH